MMEQYFDLMSASAMGGAQALGDAMLLTQIVLLAFLVIGVALVVAGVALLGAPYALQSEWAQRQRLWERISAACESDVAGTRMVGRTVSWLVAPSVDPSEPVEPVEPVEPEQPVEPQQGQGEH